MLALRSPSPRMTMTINVSLISHAFLAEESGRRLPPADSRPGPSNLQIILPPHHAPEFVAIASSSGQDPACLSPPATARDSNSFPSSISSVSTVATTPSPRRSQGKKRGNRRRRGRGKQNNSVQAWDQSSMLKQKDRNFVVHEKPSDNAESVAEVVDYSDAAGCCVDVQIKNENMTEAEVTMTEVREECSKALGIVKEDLEFFGLRHVPRSAERVRLLRDAHGVVHIGVMVRSSDLNLRSIEELVIRIDKAEQEAENHRLQVAEKTQDYEEMQRKYDKLTEEVLRLRAMLSRANQLRRESEKATELLRLEFEKLVKNFLLDDSSEAKQHGEQRGELPPPSDRL